MQLDLSCAVHWGAPTTSGSGVIIVLPELDLMVVSAEPAAGDVVEGCMTTDASGGAV